MICLVFARRRKEAEVTIEGHFLIRQLYEDKITYNIVGAAERVLSTFALNCILTSIHSI